MLQILRALVLTVLALTRFTASTAAQEVTVPDPDLNAVIRATLQKPNGPLTAQDLLGLTNLQACCRNIASLSGLERDADVSRAVLWAVVPGRRGGIVLLNRPLGAGVEDFGSEMPSPFDVLRAAVDKLCRTLDMARS